MMHMTTLAIVAALICLALIAAGIPSRINLWALAAIFLVLAVLVL